MEDLNNNMSGQRLDVFLVKAGYFRSRDRAKEAILRGDVLLNGAVQKKVAARVLDTNTVELLKSDFPYVGRAALKLEAALEEFSISVKGKVVLDIGVATGGFSDLLLHQGAKKVYGVDIGEGQLAESLLTDNRFIYKNHTDARDLQLSDFDEAPDIIVVDVSFISITALLPALLRLSNINTQLILLIKPQFELGKYAAKQMKNKKLVQAELSGINLQFSAVKLKVVRQISSPVLGKEGTQEYLWLVKLIS